MSFIKDFKAFAMKGNVVDLAIAVVIGGAFGKVVTSLVNDIIMPLLGIITGGISFSDKKIILQRAVTDATGKVVRPENALTYGVFIQDIIDFLIISFSIFIVIRLMTKLIKKHHEEQATAPAAPPEPTLQEKLLMEIRDELKRK